MASNRLAESASLRGNFAPERHVTFYLLQLDQAVVEGVPAVVGSDVQKLHVTARACELPCPTDNRQN